MRFSPGKIFGAVSAFIVTFLIILLVAGMSKTGKITSVLLPIEAYLRGFLHYGFGKSLYGRSVIADVLAVFPKTLLLVFLALILSLIAGALIGMLFSRSGKKRNAALQVFISTIPISIPDVLLIIFLQLAMVSLYDMGLPHLPVIAGNQAVGIILPVLSLTVIPVFYIARLTSMMAADTYNERFVLTSWAKGCRDSRVHWKHVWKYIRPRVIRSLYGIIPIVISNVLIVEKMYAYPGLTFSLMKALQVGDFNLIVAFVLGLMAVYSLAVAGVKVLEMLDAKIARRGAE